MGSTTNRNMEAGVVQQTHGLLQKRVFWIEYTGGGKVCDGTLAELGEQLDRPYKVPSPLGVDFQYHLDRDDGTKVMRWHVDGREVVAFEFETKQEALAKLEDIWEQEIGECEIGCSWFWTREDAQAALDEWRQELDV